MRDTRKTVTYFEEYLSRNMQDIADFEEVMTTLEDDNIDGRNNGNIILRQLYVETIYAMYSLGEEIEVIKSQFLKMLPYAVNSIDKETGMFKTVEVVALAVLFDFKGEEILRIVENSGIRDRLLQIYLSYLFPAYENSMPDTVYEKMIAAAKNTDKDDLLVYLEKSWYSDHKDADWHDSVNSKQPIYNGYWAFDVAALVKALSLNDEKLRSSMFYPGDML